MWEAAINGGRSPKGDQGVSHPGQLNEISAEGLRFRPTSRRLARSRARRCAKSERLFLVIELSRQERLSETSGLYDLSREAKPGEPITSPRESIGEPDVICLLTYFI